MKKLLLFTAAVLLVSNSFAFIAEPSVKGAAMGGAYTTGAGDDIFAASFNPASPIYGLGQLGGAWHKRESAEHIFSLGYGQNIPAGLQFQMFGNYLYDNHFANDMNNWEVKAGAAFDVKKVYDKLPLSLGVNAKYGSFNLGEAKDDAFTADFGAIADFYPFKLGFVYNNIAGNLKSIYTHNTWSLGGSYFVPVNADNALDLRLDYGKENAVTRVSAGAEYAVWRFALRAGYIKITDVTSNWTCGLGLSFGDYGRIDAAYLPYDYNKTYKLSYVIPFGFSHDDSVIGPAAAENPYYDGSGAKYGSQKDLVSPDAAAGTGSALNGDGHNEIHNVYAGGGLPAAAETAASGATDVSPSDNPVTAAGKAVSQRTAAPAGTPAHEVYIYPGMTYDDGSVAALKAANAKKAAKSAASAVSKKPKRTMK